MGTIAFLIILLINILILVVRNNAQDKQLREYRATIEDIDRLASGQYEHGAECKVFAWQVLCKCENVLNPQYHSYYQENTLR